MHTTNPTMRCTVRIFLGFLAGLLGTTGCATLQPLGDSRPKAVDTYLTGIQAYKQGDREKATQDLKAAVQQNPNLIMPRTVLGEIYRQDSKYSEATEQYEALVRMDPYTLENHYYLGVCYQFMDRLQDASNSYGNALKLNPDDANSNMNLGLVYLGMGQSDQAVRHITKATKLSPKSAAAFANLGAALDSQKKYDQAETAYRRSIELDSNQPYTLLNFASNLLKQNKPGEAITLFRLTLGKVESAWGHKRYGDALAMTRQYDDAIREYTTALKLNPRYFSAWNSIGQTLITQYDQGLQLDDQQLNAALAAWRKSLELNPNQPQIAEQIKQWSKPMPSGK